MAAGWRLQLNQWQRMNASRKAIVDDMPAPSRNDEYLLYQTLLGSFPPGEVRGAALKKYRERIVAYMRKATREAKARTSWARVNEEYEAATTAFVHALLDETHPNPFLDNFRAAVRPVAWAGFLNSLSMIAVKLTSPGVPDTYQGNEIWDFSLVDPDNRRPVDYALRARMLDELRASGDSPPIEAIFARLEDGRAKLYVIWRLLGLRAARESLFLKGGYTAVRTTGERAKHLVSFARRHDAGVALTVAPRLITSLGIRPGELPVGAGVWGDTRIEVPFLDDGTILRDALTGREHIVENGALSAARVLDQIPLAVLVK
jgi:(1->4)-alpha-D-glucan 1-alpha-D-glucosylmutase